MWCGPECNAAKLHFLLQSPSFSKGALASSGAFIARVSKTVHLSLMTKLTPNAAAERCGMSRATILRAIAAQDLPAEKQGGQWAIEGESLDQWAMQRPLRARRRAAKGVGLGRGPEITETASRPPLSVSEGDSRERTEVNENVEALKAVCEALRMVCDELRADVKALQGQVAHLSAASSSEASTAAPESATPAKRRLWPFSAKS